MYFIYKLFKFLLVVDQADRMLTRRNKSKRVEDLDDPRWRR